MLGLAAGVVLEVDDRRTPGILADIGGRLLAADAHPAHIQLGLEQGGGHGIVQHLQRVLAVNLLELKIVVMIQQSHAQPVGNFPQHGGIPDDIRKAGRSGAVLRHQVRNGDIAASDGGILSQHALRIGDHLVIRHVCRQGQKSDFLTHLPNLFGGVSVQTGKLNAVVPHFPDLLQCTPHIGGCVVAHGIQLNGDWQHSKNLLFDLTVSGGASLPHTLPL